MDGQVAIEIGYMLIQPPTKLELELGLSLAKKRVQGGEVERFFLAGCERFLLSVFDGFSRL